MWTSVLLLTLLPCLVVEASKTPKCDVKCGGKSVSLLKEGQCVCNKAYKGKYPKGDTCTVRITLNRDKRIRLVKHAFQMRQSANCADDHLRFENMFNKLNAGYDMIGKICKPGQLTGKPASIVVNTPQARMKFRSDKKGGSTANKKFLFCLEGRMNSEIKNATCPPDVTMTNFVKGYNRRQIWLTNTVSTMVSKVCCRTVGFWKNDQVELSCVDSSKQLGPTVSLTSTNKCVQCNSVKDGVYVEFDQPSKGDNKKIICSCSETAGAAIGESCAGGLPCIDTKDIAYCDSTTEMCVCGPNNVVSTDGTYCTTDAMIGESCADGENCISKHGQAFCDGTTCVCPTGLMKHADENRCTKDVAIGESCALELGCLDTLGRATCVGDVCTCPSGTSASADNSHCSKKNGYKGACDDDLDCTATRSMLCTSGSCACESPFSDYKGTCSYKSNLKGPCNKNFDDCIVSRSACISGACACESKHYLASGTTACNAVCLLKNQKTQIKKGQFVCNKKNKSGKCYYCECHKPTKNMREINSKASCGKINACKAKGPSAPIKTSIFNGRNCGDF